MGALFNQISLFMRKVFEILAFSAVISGRKLPRKTYTDIDIKSNIENSDDLLHMLSFGEFEKPVNVEKSERKVSGLIRDKRMNEVQVTAEYKSEWDTSNNCGPRPGGMIYPPPPDSPGTYEDQLECDIIPDHLYLPGYNCTTTCKANREKKVNLFCDCYNKVLTFSIVKPCRWAFENDDGCPAVEDEDDWNCDPRKEDCGSIYHDTESLQALTAAPTTITTTSTTTTLMTAAFPRPTSMISEALETHHVDVVLPGLIENIGENSEHVSISKDFVIREDLGSKSSEKRTIVNHFHIAPFLSNVLNSGNGQNNNNEGSKQRNTQISESGLDKITFLHEKLSKLQKVRDRLLIQLRRSKKRAESEEAQSL